MTNIIRACSYVAGVDSLGMRSLQVYHTELTDKQIGKLDPLNANTGTVDYSFKVYLEVNFMPCLHSCV